jgi:DNA-binding MarR family transcriptional regulator
VLTISGKNYRENGTSVGVETEVTEEEQENCASVFHDVMRLRQTLQSMASQVAPTVGLQSTEMSALDTLGKFGPLTMGQLAKRSFISPTNSTSTVKSLVDRKLVTRQRSPKSDREVLVRLTAAGEKVFRKSYPHMVHDVNDLLGSKLNQQERRTFAALLAKLVE